MVLFWVRLHYLENKAYGEIIPSLRELAIIKNFEFYFGRLLSNLYIFE